MTKTGTWKERQQQILEALDLRAVYAELGVRFTAQEPNANGWLACHAMDRDDENPSAGVCVDPASPAFGKFHDFAQDDKSWSLFDFAAQYGPYADWKAARNHYAQEAKIALPKNPPPAGRVRWDQIRVLDNAEADLSRWAESKPPITLEAIVAAEAQVVSWPQASMQPMTCIGFRSYRDLRATAHALWDDLVSGGWGQNFPRFPTAREPEKPICCAAPRTAGFLWAARIASPRPMCCGKWRGCPMPWHCIRICPQDTPWSRTRTARWPPRVVQNRSFGERRCM